MKITFSDILLSTCCSAACVGLGVGAAWLTHGPVMLPHGFQAVFLIVIFCIVFVLSTIGILYFLRVFWPLEEGVFVLGTDSRSLVWKLLGFLYVVHLWPLINASLVPVNMRGMAYSMIGAKVGKSVMVGGKILEPTLVEVGNYSMLGEDCILTAHTVVGNEVTLGRIIVGDEVTIGGTSVILPDVRIGDGAIVAPGAVVTKGSRVGPGEIWGGVPAKKIGQRDMQPERSTQT
ncbi:acyltransferase [Desulfonatronum parangueonense]